MASSSRRGHLPIPGCNHCVLCDAQWDAPDSGVKMADEEEIDPERIIRSITNSIDTTIGTLKRRFQELYDVVLKDSTDSPVEASSQYCQDFCRVCFILYSWLILGDAWIMVMVPH